MKTIKVSFFKKDYPNQTLYTYKTEDAMMPGDIIWVEAPDGIKRARVFSIDAEYDIEAEEQWGELKLAFAEKPDEPEAVRTFL